VLLLGTAGLGKSCLAAKIYERFPGHTGIIVHGKLDSINLEAALKDAFIMSRDENGAAILSQRMEIKDKLARLCAGNFKEQRYLMIRSKYRRCRKRSTRAINPGSGGIVESLAPLSSLQR
jgi:hypothetical protein